MSEAPIGEVVCAFKADGDFFKGKAWKTEEGIVFFVTDTALEPIHKYAGFISARDLWSVVSRTIPENNACACCPTDDCRALGTGGG
jgi:hypothetical protein